MSNAIKASSKPIAKNFARYGKHPSSNSPKSKLEALFRSAPVKRLKEQICEMGRRQWQRAYVDGNGGNMAVRVGEDIALCTPTLVSKGSLTPEDICLVDFDGNQILGAKKRTSEILMHLQIMKRRPEVMATCHCHPPYATAFAIAGIAPPNRMLPEFEIFCSVGVAPYRTPGTPELGRLVAGLADEHNTILMANHGVVTLSHTNIEEAYWRMEIIEAYCRTIVIAQHLGQPLNTFSDAQMEDLLNLRQSFSSVDPRYV